MQADSLPAEPQGGAQPKIKILKIKDITIRTAGRKPRRKQEAKRTVTEGQTDQLDLIKIENFYKRYG